MVQTQRLKRYLIGLLATFLLIGCAKDPIGMIYRSMQDYDRELSNVMVFGMIQNVGARIDFENQMVYAAQKYQLKATNSLAFLPPELGKPLDDVAQFRGTLTERGYDAIMTLTVIDIRAPRYIEPGADYQPLTYYDRFRNYYYKTYDVVYSTNYLNSGTRYFVETNLYELKGGTLIWSGRSEVFDPIDLPSFSKFYAKSLLKELYKSGTLVQSASSN